MLWPFKHFSKSRGPVPGTIEAIYGMIVTQARAPVFYHELGVADTVNGRFDLLLLHLWMVLRRFRSAGAAAEVSQALFDHFCADMDANLREMGVGDLAVPKRMQAFGEAFYGRGTAYDAAFADDDALALAFCRNVLNGKGMENARRLAIYAKRVLADLDGVDDAALLAAAWTFPAPAEAGKSHS
jgi:cytochrome b pre-mRNA-processing protein 3